MMKTRVILAVLLAVFVALPAAAATAPFSLVFRGVDGGAPGVVATVSRRVGGASVTLPAAAVPALRGGDAVDVAFVGYAPPVTAVRYHANVAFITATAPQHWLYPRSSPRDRLFAPARDGRRPGLHFVYGEGTAQGTPIFFVVPEDKKTRGMDGVRDYVGAHPTDFKTMAASANQAVDRYAWFRDFLGAFSNGQISVLDGRRRISEVAAAFGADPSSVDACYLQSTVTTQIQSCIQGQLNALAYKTNFNAPTEAQFFGGLAGAVSPTRFATYLAPLLTVWKLFVSTGHQEYEYLPTTLSASDPSASALSPELLSGEKVPTLRPPAAYTSVVFFSIGEQNGAPAPKVVNDAPGRAICGRDPRLVVPLHVDRSSRYLNATALEVTADDGTTRRVPIPPDTTEAPIVERALLDDGAPAHRIRLVGRYGFDALAQPLNPVVDVAVPRPAAWSIASAPHRALHVGDAIALIASSPAAPCVTHAELQIGGTTTIPLSVALVDARHLALSGTLGRVPPGAATLRLDQAVAGSGAPIESTVALTIAPGPPSVDMAHLPDVHLGDRHVALAGSGFDRVEALRIGGTVLKKTSESTAVSACFAGPPIDGSAPGSVVRASLVESDGRTGEAFALQTRARRPQIALDEDVSPMTRFSSDVVRLRLSSNHPLPQRVRVLVRRTPATASPCDAASGTPVPDARAHPLGAASLLVDLVASEVLKDDAFGALQIAVADAADGAASDWVPIPGRFARAPHVDRIECTGATTTCRLVGSGLAAIAGVALADGTVAPPDQRCVVHDKEPGCLLVPDEEHYRLVLIDGGVTFDVPDAAIVRATSASRTPRSP